MHRRNWKCWVPNSLQEAVEGCVAFTQDRHNHSVDRVADLVGESKWTVYKWLEQGSIPSKKIPGFEHACGCNYVTAYLATTARKLLIDMPTGRPSGAGQILVVQEACNAATGALIAFAEHKSTAEQTIAALQRALELLAYERSNIQRYEQPELDL